MFSEIRIRAYAKINFGLKVLPLREDGFHNLESIFQTIGLYDELIVTWNEEKSCVVSCDSMQLPSKNTLTSAYQAFCEAVEVDVPGVRVNLIKGIPSGGGLGGGSADAAALVRVLEKLCRIKLSVKQLDYVASKTGSDVFFFMHCDDDGKGCALVSGRGEIVKEIKPRHDLFLLLVFPDVGSSTKEAYAQIDRAFAEGKEVKGPGFCELEGIYNSSVEKWTFINTFTPVVTETIPVVTDAICALKKVGCCYAEMSGSGSTVFGVFTSEQQAEFGCNLLGESWNCKLVQTV